jgi:hypothetical protein
MIQVQLTLSVRYSVHRDALKPTTAVLFYMMNDGDTLANSSCFVYMSYYSLVVTILQHFFYLA